MYKNETKWPLEDQERISTCLPQNSTFRYHFKEILQDKHMKKADLLRTTHIKSWVKEGVTMM